MKSSNLKARMLNVFVDVCVRVFFCVESEIEREDDRDGEE